MDDRLRWVIDATVEALNNAARHSGSSAIDLFAEIHDETLQVSVRDRGSGFDADSVGEGVSRRIVGRIEDIGGTVSIDSAPGSGTSVLMRVPL